MIENNKMNRAAKILVSKLENIPIRECKDCKQGISGIPNCKIGECDLPIELMTENGKIGIIASNLKEDMWNFRIEDRTCYMYYFLGFDEYWKNMEHAWKIPHDDVIEHLEKTTEDFFRFGR